MKFFSKSDVKALEYGYDEKNHKEQAWVNCAPIPFEDIIDEEWLRNDLEIASHSMVI